MKIADAKLTKAADGMWRPAENSAVRGASEGDFPAVKIDIDGQQREGRSDAGCDQISKATVASRPLTAKDAGPSWMKRQLEGAKD